MSVTRGIRVPDRLYEEVAKLAEKEQRTWSNAVVYLLTLALKARKA